METATRTILVAQPGWYLTIFYPAEKGGKWERGFWMQSIVAWEIDRESDADKDWISHTATPITMQGSPSDTAFDDIWAVKGPDGRFDFVDTIFSTEAEALDYASGLHQEKLKYAAQKTDPPSYVPAARSGAVTFVTASIEREARNVTP